MSLLQGMQEDSVTDWCPAGMPVYPGEYQDKEREKNHGLYKTNRKAYPSLSVRGH